MKGERIEPFELKVDTNTVYIKTVHFWDLSYFLFYDKL